MARPSSSTSTDPDYLRNQQYRDGTRLDARVRLHQRYATSEVSLPDFIAERIEWPPGGAVLECGAGPGLFWENRHAPRSLSLTLTDLSPGMVELAVERARANGFTDVTGRECDVQDLPYPDDTFDLVVANHMLYHVPDPDRGLAELARVVRPDGVVVAATNGAGHMGALTAAVAEVFGPRDERLDDVFGIDSGERRLRRHFTSITWHAFDNDLVVDDPEAAIAYGLSYPPGDSATAQQAAALAAALRRRFVDGRLRIRTRAGVFIGRGRRPVDDDRSG
jgi:SAM-dependent methyltransferase